MSPSALGLSELEQDALTELVNIGVSRAAAGLRKMIGQEVLLSVPSVEVVGHRTAAILIGERTNDSLVAVRQDFEGAFSGRALLIFPLEHSMELVRAVAHGSVPDDELPGIEDEALAETGNVVLNGCLAVMANMLHRKLSMSLPEVLRGDGPSLFNGRPPSDDDGVVLFLYINFAISGRDISGYIAMLMDLPSLEALKRLIADFIARVLGDDQAALPA